MQRPTAQPPRPARAWAASTVWAGWLWIVLAMLPVPATTLAGLPFAIYAILGGWVAARGARAEADTSALRRARWGIRLGCAGFVYLALFYLVAGGFIVAGLIAAVSAALRGAQ